MSTALFDLAMSVPRRIGELNLLIDNAKLYETSREPLHNAICRAASVLMASHLEGFLKELTSSLVADLSYYHGGFDKMPPAMQRSFCEKIATYEGVPQVEINERIRQLIVFFSQNSVPIDMQAFTYKENPNKNATSAFIDKALARFGVPNVINAISGGRLENVFDNDTRTNYIIIRDLKRFRSSLYDFPYAALPTSYAFHYEKPRGQGQTLWHSFIEEVMIRRHKIAHGDTLDNESTWEDLKSDATKLEVMMQGIMYAAAGYLAVSLPSGS